MIFDLLIWGNEFLGQLALKAVGVIRNIPKEVIEIENFLDFVIHKVPTLVDK